MAEPCRIPHSADINLSGGRAVLRNWFLSPGLRACSPRGWRAQGPHHVVARTASAPRGDGYDGSLPAQWNRTIVAELCDALSESASVLSPVRARSALHSKVIFLACVSQPTPTHTGRFHARYVTQAGGNDGHGTGSSGTGRYCTSSYRQAPPLQRGAPQGDPR